MNTPVFVWLITIPLIGTPLVYLSGHSGIKPKGVSIPQIVCLLILLACWVPFGMALTDINNTPASIFTFGDVRLCLDGLGLLLAAVALGLGTMVTLFSGPYMAIEENQEKYYAMLLVMTGVMIGLGCACDLFNLWIWFEVMAISSYLLVAFYREKSASLEAGVKYLVQSALGSALVLIGIALVFAKAGTLNLLDLGASAELSPILGLAGVLFIVGFGVKAALVPLHTWLPDAHSQAPSGISAMLSGVVIEAGLIAMLRSLGCVAGSYTAWGPWLMGFGCLNMLIGNLMAWQQIQIKRLLAYSSLVHIGYMLVGLGIAIYLHSASGAQGSFFHLFNHAAMKGLAFLAAGALLYSLHIASGEHGPLTTEDLSGAAQRYPIVALTFSLAVFGLGGIPPLSGFMSKWQILSAGFETPNNLVNTIAIFTGLNSVFSLAYYAPLVNRLYRCQPSQIVQRGQEIPFALQLPLLGLSVIILVAGLWPGSVNWLTDPAGAAWLANFIH